MNFNSRYKQQFANKTLKWFGSDSEEIYLTHLKTRYEELKKYNWLDSEIDYRFNSEGFRTEEFDQSPNIMFLGCSNTMGLGVPEESRWTNIVADQLKLKCNNLSIAGSSPDTAFRFTLGWLDKLNPKILVYRTSPGIRFELISADGIENLYIKGVKNHRLKFVKDYYYHYAFTNTNYDLNLAKNTLAIRYLCEKKNVKLFIDTNPTHMLDDDLARDLLHPGLETNKIYADYVLSQLN